ncbi:RND family efflux transporter MFP subunit [Rhizobium sp. BK212]|nr:RND family efflux transporter MFP subunit [Rhizobium sp. BK212]
MTFAAAFVAAALLFAFRNFIMEHSAAPPLAVSLTAPSQQDCPETLLAEGWLKPWQEAIVASETGGLRITEVLVDVGSVVAKGQTLVRLSQESVLADLQKHEAAIATAKANLSKARGNVDQVRQLGPSGAGSAEDIAQYVAAEQTAVVSLKAAKADFDNDRVKLEQTTITAADDGLIISRSAELGAVVSAGAELFRMVRQQRVEWQAEVPADYLPRISEGSNVVVKGPDDQRIQGKVRLVGPSVSADTSRAIVYVAFPAGVHPRTGLYVTGKIELQATPAPAFSKPRPCSGTG